MKTLGILRWWHPYACFAAIVIIGGIAVAFAS